MMKDALAQTDLLTLPLIAFVLFLATFLFVVGRLLWRGKKDPHLVAAASLPLTEDDRNRPEHDDGH